MITQEQIEINGKVFIHTYSDMYMLKQVETGVLYEEAYDKMPCRYTYEETDIELEKEEEEHKPLEPIEE